MIDADRRTGRTTRMLEDALREVRAGGHVIVIVHAAHFRAYCERILIELGIREPQLRQQVRFVVAREGGTRQLRGRQGATLLVADHHAFSGLGVHDHAEWLDALDSLHDKMSPRLSARGAT